MMIIEAAGETEVSCSPFTGHSSTRDSKPRLISRRTDSVSRYHHVDEEASRRFLCPHNVKAERAGVSVIIAEERQFGLVHLLEDRDHAGPHSIQRHDRVVRHSEVGDDQFDESRKIRPMMSKSVKYLRLTSTDRTM